MVVGLEDQWWDWRISGRTGGSVVGLGGGRTVWRLDWVVVGQEDQWWDWVVVGLGGGRTGWWWDWVVVGLGGGGTGWW